MRTIKAYNCDLDIIVDDEDYEFLNKLRWRVTRHRLGKNLFLVHTNIYLSRFLLGFPTKLVDHKNGNSLDNRKENLRVATNMQNGQNQRKRKSVSSRFKGVYYFKNRWSANITYEKRQLHLGRFVSEVEAAKEYDKVARKLFGEFGCFNFPEAGEQSALEHQVVDIHTRKTVVVKHIKRQVTAEQVNIINDLYTKGETKAEIARKVNLSRTTVWRVVEKKLRRLKP